MTPKDGSSTVPHVAIIGGGIAGLSSAWYLQQQAQAAGKALRYTVLERDARWGGKILTDRVKNGADQPFVIEGGPDSFITQKPWALELARELGLGDRLLGTNDERRKVYVVNQGKPTPLPDGVLLIVPTKLMPFALSPLISPLGKLRMALDLVIPAKRDGQDETLAEFVRRRLGREALDKIAEPLMSGIYNADAEEQSLLATFPRFRALEEKHGSLTRGMLAGRRGGMRQVSVSANQPGPNGSGGRRAWGGESKVNGSGQGSQPRLSVFMSLADGTTELVEALLDQLQGELRLNATVEGLVREAHGYRLSLAGGETLWADSVIFATPAYVAADLLAPLAPEAAKELAAIRYVSTGTISLAFRQQDVGDVLQGSGLVVPRSERRPINAITLSSVKFHRRAPDGHILMRAFFGGSRSPQSMALDDGELLAAVRQELQDLLGVSAQPLFHRIYRWHRSNPQYDVGHLERVAAIRKALPAGIYVTGSPYGGVGIPDCVKQGRETATHVLREGQEVGKEGR